MAMVKVWNITDDTNPDVKPHNRMVLGKTLKPGQAVKVDAARLAKAHKVHKDVGAGFLFIGPKPPVSYRKVKNRIRAKADARRVDANGNYEGNKPLVPEQRPPIPKPPKKEKAKVEDKVAVTDKATAALKPAEATVTKGPPAADAPAPADADAPELTGATETKSGSKKRKGK
jgi:hypothetical protein